MDRQELIRLFHCCFPHAVCAEKTVSRLLTDPNRTVLEARNDGGRLIGAAVIHANTINLLCVDAAYQKHGIGSQLLAVAEARIAACGHTTICIGAGGGYLMPGVPATNANLHFFSKRGYIHSWGECECFDMVTNLKGSIFTEKLGDTYEGVHYRFATPCDLAGITHCIQDTKADFTPFFLDEALYTGNGSQRILVAEANGCILGAVIVSIRTLDDQTGSLGCTTVHTQYQGRGIASHMIKIATHYMQEQGCHRGFLGYTYSGLDTLYSQAGYFITQKYMMAVKTL